MQKISVATIIATMERERGEGLNYLHGGGIRKGVKRGWNTFTDTEGKFLFQGICS